MTISFQLFTYFLILFALIPAAHFILGAPLQSKVETTQERINKIDLSNTALQTEIGNLSNIEENTIPRNDLRGNSYTDNEYKQIKEKIISRSKEGSIRPDEEFSMWIELLNKACAGKTLTGKIDQEKLNSLMETDCK